MEKRRSLLVSLLCATVISISSTTLLPNLRTYRALKAIGRFAVPRNKLEAILKNRLREDHQCGKYISLSLPKSLPSEHYDESLYGEVMIVLGTVEETGLDYLPCELKKLLETPYRSLHIFIPYLSNGNHGLLTLMEMTEAKNRLTPPFITNEAYRINVDAIVEDGENVKISIGKDEMTLKASRNISCQTDENVGNDFDQISGTNVTTTNYPRTFDWNCGSLLDWDTGYCRVLRDNFCEIQRFDGDVCAHIASRRSIRCTSSMGVISASGVFRHILSSIFDGFPVESFEGESIDRNHVAGVKYPCLSQ